MAHKGKTKKMPERWNQALTKKKEKEKRSWQLVKKKQNCMNPDRTYTHLMHIVKPC